MVEEAFNVGIGELHEMRGTCMIMVVSFLLSFLCSA